MTKIEDRIASYGSAPPSYVWRDLMGVRRGCGCRRATGAEHDPTGRDVRTRLRVRLGLRGARLVPLANEEIQTRPAFVDDPKTHSHMRPARTPPARPKYARVQCCSALVITPLWTTARLETKDVWLLTADASLTPCDATVRRAFMSCSLT